MKKNKLLTTESTNLKRRNFSKMFPVLFILLMVSSLVISSTPSDHSMTGLSKQVRTLSTGLNTGFKSAVAPNPGYTPGPNCVYNVILLLDRSFSVLNGGGWPDVSAFKQSVIAMYNALYTRANNAGGHANVSLYAFATYTVMQNGPGTEPPGTPWLYSLDISQPLNLWNQAVLVNSVHFTNSSNSPFPVGLPAQAFRGYSGGIYSNASGYGATNYHDAFSTAAKAINFWTANDASLRGDQDVDMVIMVTDGEPTVNNGGDGIATPGESSLNTGNSSDQADKDWAMYSVNQLRTGAEFRENVFGANVVIPARAPTNVRGILAGSDAVNPTAQNTMNYVFGPGNWLGAQSYGQELTDRLIDTIAPLSCHPAIPKSDETSSLELSVTADNPVVDEGNSTSFSFQVKNTGSVPVKNITISLSGATTSFASDGSIIPPGGSAYFNGQYPLLVPYGGPDPLDIQFISQAEAVYDPATQNIDTSTPISNPATGQIKVKRVQFPS